MKHVRLNLILASLLILTSCSSESMPSTNQTDQFIRVVVPPNPNALPLFITTAQNPDLKVKLLPVPGVPELTAALQGNQADVAVFFSAAGAQIYNKGALPNLRLWNINVWRAIYLITSEKTVTNFNNLKGLKILASFQGGAPDLMMRAAINKAGYSPEMDFAIEYLPSVQVTQLMLSGKGAAVLLPEPQASQLIAKANSENITLGAVIDLQAGFGSSSWQEGEAPLGGILVLQEILDNPVLRTNFEQFAAAYDAAIQYINANPDQAAEIAAEGYNEMFGSSISAQIIASALKSGRLLFRSQPVSELRPDLDNFLVSLIGQAPSDEFYVK